jgi:hypothetical protein
MNMSARRTVARSVVGLALAAIVGVSGCGTTDVTRARLEGAVGPAFTNLYVEQAKILGISGVSATSIGAHTTCDRGGPKVADSGPGADWICMIHFTDNTGAVQDGKFELQVKSNSCYIAGGPSKLVGGATITDAHGRDVTNPVFEWDGCFDPHG